MKTTFEIKCPICGHQNNHIWQGISDRAVICCDDPADGGCGEYFAATWILRPEIKTYRLTMPGHCEECGQAANITADHDGMMICDDCQENNHLREFA